VLTTVVVVFITSEVKGRCSDRAVQPDPVLVTIVYVRNEEGGVACYD